MAERRHSGRKRPPNPHAQLLQQWRAVYRTVRQQAAGRLAVGGKSMGGRMASLLADELAADALRSEEHTSELQSLMRISYAVFCLKKKNKQHNKTTQSVT